MSLTKADRETQLKTGDPVYKQFVVDVEAMAERRARFTITTDDPDRERDVVDTTGVETASFERNPVVLFAHSYRDLPIGRCVGLERSANKIVATVEFASEDMCPMAEHVYRMVKAGYLRAASIGFRPLEWTYNEERGGVDFKRVELLEFSIVPVPANSMALIAAGADGIDSKVLKGWAEETLRVIAEAEAETKAANQPSLEELARQNDCVAPFNRDEIGWKAFVKARKYAEKKGALSVDELGGMLDDYGFEDEAKALGFKQPEKKSAAEQTAAENNEKTTLSVTIDAEKVAAIVEEKLAELRAEVDAVAKAGRVLSKANESKLRAATEAISKAQDQIAEVLKAVEKEEANEEPAPETLADDEAVVLSFESETEDHDVIELETEADADVIEIDAADLESMIRSALADIVRPVVAGELAAARGRID